MSEQRLMPSSQIVGNMGLYYVAFRLSQLGWNVMPTARNARGIDVIAYTPDARRYIGIQVKALTKLDNVRVGSEDVMGDFWIIVTNTATPNPDCFVLLPEEVRQGCKLYGGALWLPRAAYNRPEYRQAWGRIGDLTLRSPAGNDELVS